MQLNPRKILVTTIKWFLAILLGLILLLGMVWSALQTNWGQQKIKGIAENYLTKKLHTKFSVGSIEIKWLSRIVLKDIYLEDLQKRPLLVVRNLDISYDISGILEKRIGLPQIKLDGARVELYRMGTDSSFNFSFIPAAFASTDPKPVDTTHKAFEIIPGKLNITNFGFLLDDQYGGQSINVALNTLGIEVDQFDLELMHFHTKHIFTDSLRYTMQLTKGQGPVKVVAPDTTSSPFRFGSDTVLLSKTAFNLSNESNQFDIQTLAGDLSGSSILFDLESMHATVKYLQLKDHRTAVSMVSKPATKPSVNVEATSSKPFRFAVDHLLIERNEILFDDNGKKNLGQKQFDPAHLDLQQIYLDVAGIDYNGVRYLADIKAFNLQEKCGFRLQELRTKASYADTAVNLQSLVLRTNQNQLGGNIRIAYKSPGELTSKPSSTLVNINLTKSRLQLDELLYFAPELGKNKSFSPLLGKVFFLNTRVSGQLNKLHIPELVLTQDRTRLLASADIFELPDTKKLRIDLHLKELSGTRKDLLGFLPKNTLPDSLLHYIPEEFRLFGNFKGTLQNITADGAIRTSSGNVTLKGRLQNMQDTRNAIYDLDVSLEEIKLGQILQDSLYGPVSGHVILNGKGTDLKTANAVVKAHINKAYYKGYTYGDIDLDAKLAEQLLDATLDSHDPNLAVQSKTVYNLDKAHSSFKTETNIDQVDLFKLGFANDTLTIKGKLHADIPLLDSAKINGEVLAANLDMQYGSKKVRIDSILANAVYEKDSQFITIRSPMFDGVLKGKYSLQNLPDAARVVANKYIYTTSNDTSFTKSVSAMLSANVHMPDSLLSIVPGLKRLSPFTVRGRIDTDSSVLAFFTTIEKIRYRDYELDTLVIGALDNPEGKGEKNIQYVLIMNHLTSPSFNLEKSGVIGAMQKGIIDGRIALFDPESNPRYSISYKITNDPTLPYLSIGDTLLINKRNWLVNKDNVVYLNPKLLKGSKLQISNADALVTIFADSTNVSGLPLGLNIKDFKLKDISDIFISDTSLVEGTLNGDVHMVSFDPFQFTSTLQIDSLKLKEANAGTLKINVKQETVNEMLADVSLKGYDNDVSLKGSYNASTKEGDMHLEMPSLDLHTVAPFVQNYLGKLKGRLKGDLTVRGKLDEPSIRGTLRTDSVDLVYKAYGTELLIPAGEVDFKEGELQFSNFDFLDSAGHKGRLEGSLFVKSLQEYKIDIRLNTKNFLVVDKRRSIDQLIYGPAHANAQITLKGDQDVINIDGSVNVIDSSKLTYIYESNASASKGEGLIEFFDPLHPVDTLALKSKKAITAGPKFAVNTYINVTPLATVTIVLDELSGDQLSIKGTAALNFSMDAGGRMNLTGNYEVESGDYDLAIGQIIKKKFSIEKGSRITWSGDPLKADMDITALYKIKTTAGELMTDVQNTPGIDKQKLNFEVYLMLTKELLKPEIEFRLDMPESDQAAFNGSVYTRLKQVNTIPSDLNKQVMGLLAINHFIADNPFSSLNSAGSSMETKAFATAGRLLTQELTELVGNAIKGVDIDFGLDVNEDYTSGSAVRNTDLKVGLSKKMANNRLSVYVGSTFALEGQNQDANALDGLAGDITLEYMLTKDGRYRIKAFRENLNNMSFEGTIVKTGVTFVVVLEFNKFKNAFKKRKKKADN